MPTLFPPLALVWAEAHLDFAWVFMQQLYSRALPYFVFVGNNPGLLALVLPYIYKL